MYLCVPFFRADIIFGTTIDETMKDSIKITLIAIGFDQTKQKLQQFVPESSQFMKKGPQQQSQPTVNGKSQLQKPEDVDNNEDMWEVPATFLGTEIKRA